MTLGSAATPFAISSNEGVGTAASANTGVTNGTLFASWLQPMRYVLVPLLLPAIIAAWLMLFVIFIRELGATILLYAQGTETISVVLVILSEHGSTYVAALAIIQVVMLLGAFLLFRATRASLVQA